MLWSLNVQDRYHSPGQPVTIRLANGDRVIHQNGSDIFLSGPGAGPQGDRPFLDKYNLETGKTEHLFRSEAGRYETFVALLDDSGTKILTERESPTEAPNFYVRTLGSGGGEKALTHYPDPTPQLRGITKQLVTYKREDGVPLSFMLYLPPGYKQGTRLPTVVWAYPLEFNDADTAGQVTGSTDRFTTIWGRRTCSSCCRATRFWTMRPCRWWGSGNGQQHLSGADCRWTPKPPSTRRWKWA